MDTSLRGIDAAALDGWFQDNIADVHAPLRFELIAGGHSNLTYRVDEAGGRKFALRRPPLGFKPRHGAHDVVREYRILAALKDSAVPVPVAEALCTDSSIIGASFYVTRWVEGYILDRPSHVEAVLADSGARRRAAFSLVDTLAELHRCEVDAVGLGDLGQRDNYLERQLIRLGQVWETTKTRELPIIDSLHKELLARCPPQRYTGIVHSDYRFGNVMLGAAGDVAAVLDWELCALGDVTVDVAYLLTNWDLPEDPWPDVWMQPAPTRAGGFPSRHEILARYAEKTGFDLQAIDYYCAFCYWRIAVLAEGIKRRYETGVIAQHTDLDALDRRVRNRAAMAERYLKAA
ncbi:phosphotransferase family protein [Aromatoleum petrolei]|uniref:Phosphotransferase n=1 Tax=Aromatoleum petrolei TaxID=76116 RepID=A0ABX1MPL1_9RHOO|nr:phosphotransferase family protein [Aromatoleum petrolei]NMF88588.1 phosphotransferase [Aromatoleum petrolei]QTQ34705.1 Aminoglycoside phosphotransferase [Aromatoleum petrolei]